MVKVGILDGTDSEKKPVEIFINLFNALIIIPIAAWSLLNQWATSGTGKKTDDIRTTEKGIIPIGSPDSFVDFIEPHKGDRNLLYRSVMYLLHFFFTFWLLFCDIDPFHMLVQGLCEFMTCGALLYQWRHDHESTHYVRAVFSFITVP